MEIKISKLLSTQGYIQVNKHLIKTVGLDTAVFIGEICAEYNFYDTNNKLEEDGSFFSTIENIENNTGLKRKRQEACIAQLTELGILSMELKGLPCKRYFYIDFEKLLCLFKTNKNVQKVQASMSVEDKQDESKSACNKHNIININNKHKEIKDVVDDDVQAPKIDYDTIQNEIEENKEKQNEDKVIKALNEFASFNTGNVALSYLNESDISDDLKVYAIKRWVGSKKDYREPSVNYLKGILRNIKQSGATTAEEVDAYMENQYKNKNDYLATKNRELDIREKELAYKEKNQPYYQKQIEMQSGKVEQKQQQQNEEDRLKEQTEKYHDDYIAGKITREKGEELGIDRYLIDKWDYEIYCNDPINQAIGQKWLEKQKEEAQKKKDEGKYKKW